MHRKFCRRRHNLVPTAPLEWRQRRRWGLPSGIEIGNAIACHWGAWLRICRNSPAFQQVCNPCNRLRVTPGDPGGCGGFFQVRFSGQWGNGPAPGCKITPQDGITTNPCPWVMIPSTAYPVSPLPFLLDLHGADGLLVVIRPDRSRERSHFPLSIIK